MMSDMNPVVPSAMMFSEPYQPMHGTHHESTATAPNDSNDSNTNSNEESNNNSNNKKRTRVTPSQLTVLEETFNITATPDSKMRKQLASKLQMPERSIQIWFQNRRAKVKMLQKRFLLRQEQEAARARLYGNSNHSLHHPHLHHHHHHSQQHPYQYNPYQYPNPVMAANTPLPYWYSKYPQYPQYQQKLPIHRAWSTDSSHQQLIPPLQHPTTLSSSSSATTLSQPFPYESSNSTTTPTTATTHSNSISSHRSDNNPSSLLLTNANGLTEVTVSPSPTPQSFLPKRMESEPLTSSTTALFSSLSMDPSYLQCSEENDEGCITATALTIGSWHRMKIDQQDLTCSYNTTSRFFSWHIRDNNYHFKMVLPFDSIQSIELNVLDDNITAQVDLDVFEPPQFFMEKVTATTTTTMNSEEARNGWVQCSDFTEGMQASIVLRHTIRGLATDLRQELLAIAGVDDRLCQVTRFPSSSQPSNSIMNIGGSASVPPPVNIGLLTSTATSAHDNASLLSHMDYTTSSSNSLLNPHSQNYWRHQSLPPSVLMTDTLPATTTNTTTHYPNNSNSFDFFNTDSTTANNANINSLHQTSYRTLDTI